MANANDVKGWETHRGRSYEFDETEAGTAIIDLKNTQGKYDPTNAASPYAGNLLALRQSKINVQHPIAGSWHDVFTGYVEQWNPKRERRFPQRMPTGCSLVDGFSVLERAKVTQDPDGGRYYEIQHVDDRILAALGDARWPAARTTIFTGNVYCQAIVYDAGTSILEVLRDAAGAEFPGVANLFTTKSGKIAFRGRYARFNPDNPDYDVNRWHVGDASAIADDPTLIPIFDLDWALDDKDIYNRAIVSPQGIAPASLELQVIEDAPSIAKYGPREQTIPDLLLENGATTGFTALQECRLFGKYIVENFKEPLTRITEIVFRPTVVDPAYPVASATWDFVLGAEIGDIVHVTTGHPGGGGFDNTEFFIEGIHHKVDRQEILWGKIPDWEMKLDLSPRGYYPEDGFPTDPD